MKYHPNRRDFLAASAATAGFLAAGRLQAAEPKVKLRKALISSPSEKALSQLKAAGFEGIEARGWNVSPDAAAKTRVVAEKLGMKIHSVMRAWTNVNSSNAAAVAKDVASVKTALKAAEGYGADVILWVPCKIGGGGPQPWEFDIEFDEKTGHIKQVVKGDNAKYKGYIDAHNRSTDASRAAIEKLIPTAEKTGVVIGIENVWNNLWVKPAIFANFIASFDSPFVQCYYDIGNHVKYAPSEEWIRALGNLIVACHVKDFKLKPDGRGGSFCNIREGSVNWPAVRKELDTIGRDELWMTIEGSGGLSLAEKNKRLDQIIAGS